MLYCCHRVNTIVELLLINNTYGVEIDLRDTIDGKIHLSHDPFILGEDFENFLQYYNHSFLILNIKSERIEYKILDLLKKYNIIDYFFLDSSFPMIYKLSSEGNNKSAVRFSEFEDITTVLNMSKKVEWVWVDCFTQNPLTKDVYIKLKDAGFKICFVSPELQNQKDKIDNYKEYFDKENIKLDMVCTKSYNISKWRELLQIIIPMSGLGQRFIDSGYQEPKPLIKVDNKYIIKHVIDLFPNETNVKFICNDLHLKTTDMKNILKSLCETCDIYEVPVENREGPVQAVSLIYDNIDDNKEVIISYCDYGTYWNYDKFLNDTRERNADGAVVCYRGFHPHMLGSDNYAFLQETEVGSRWLNAIQEKQPFTENKMSEYASNGTYYFKSGAIMKKYFKILMDKKMTVKNEYYVSMVYNLLVNDGLKVSIFESDNMLQWGTPYDLEIYNDWSNYFNNIILNQDTFIDNFDTTLILPMAGAGSRFTKKNYSKPKPLIDVNGLPMVIQAVNCLPTTTNKMFICLQSHLDTSNIYDSIKYYYKDSKIYGINEITQGQACTCELGMNMSKFDLEKPILISACDNGVYYNIKKYQELVDDISIDIIVWSFINNPTSKNNPNMYAWMEVDDNDIIKSVSCKKFDSSKHDIKKSHVIIGTMFFRKAKYFLDGLNENYNNNVRSNNEFYVDDIINQNIKIGLKVKVFQVENYICWGTPDDYETYIYWRNFFDKCNWHNYKKILDKTYKPLEN